MKYSEDFTKKVVGATDIVKLIGQYTQLTQNGDIYTGKSPFLQTQPETLIVDSKTQTFQDLSTNKKGNAIMFLIEKEGLAPDSAIEKLAKNAGISITQDDLYKETSVMAKRNLYSVYRDAATFYTRQLNSPNGEEGKKYLTGRSLTEETQKKFELGFAPPKGDMLYKFLKKQGYSDEIMVQAGLIKIADGKPYDYFRNRVMFPIKDRDDNIVAFGGRVMDDSKPKYLNSPESLIFNKSATLYGMNEAKLTNRNYYIVCEGYMDVISMHQAGFDNAIAPLGTALTLAHLPQLEAHGIGKKYGKTDGIVLAFDSDEAGQKAIAKAINRIQENGNLPVRVLDMSPHKDPNEFLTALGHDAFQQRILSAIDAYNYTIKKTMEKLLKGVESPTTEQRENAMHKCVDTIGKMLASERIKTSQKEKRMQQIVETMYDMQREY